MYWKQQEAEGVTEMLKIQKGYKVQDKSGMLSVEGVDFYILERETDIIFEEENTSLFDDEFEADEPEEVTLETVETQPEAEAPVDLAALSSLKELVNVKQTPVKQRKVSKIVVLFDDGSFQEL